MRGLLDFGIGVHHDQPAHAVVLDDVDDALVGQAGHREVGEGAERGVRLERTGELLADRRKQSERVTVATLGVVHASALERECALLSSVTAKARSSGSKTCPRGKRNPSAPSVTSLARGVRKPWSLRDRRSRESASRAAVAQEHGLAPCDGLADRRALRERECCQPESSSSVKPNVATISTAVESADGSATRPASAPTSSRPSPSATS